MKKEIHPEYFSQAIIKCACGKEIKVGSTQKELNVEICDSCHPFFTGQDKVLDTAGRVEKFRAKRAAAGPAVKSKTAKKAEKKQKRDAVKKES